MPRNYHWPVTALLLAGAMAVVGCSDTITGPSPEAMSVTPGRTPCLAALDPDIPPSVRGNQYGRDLVMLRADADDTGRITVIIGNPGPSYFYGPFEVGLYREYGEHAALVQIERWGDGETLLAPGATITLVIQRESCGGSMRYHVVVDPENRVHESNEENNRSHMFFSWGCS